LNPEISKVLNIKEYLLQVQGIILGKLAIKENYIKGLIEDPDLYKINFDVIVINIEKAIRALQY